MQSTVHQKGVALVIVLWMLIVLTIMVTAYSGTTRTEMQMTTRQTHTAQVRGIAEAGIWLAVYDLLKPHHEHKWRKDNTPRTIKLDDSEIIVSIMEETGKIDLNTARAEFITSLLYSAGVEHESAIPLTDAILDWRDRDNATRPAGAEDQEYFSQGLDYGAKDGPFNSIEELQMVMGMTPELFRKLKPMLTIHSHFPGINPQAAPKAVLEALPNITTESISSYLSRRENEPQSTAVPAGVDPRYFARTRGNTFSITSTGNTASNNCTIYATVLINPNSNPPYSILSWEQNRISDPEI